ncbi:hypothetical protein IAU60_006682 [Kwoniella sp. DSM 27419]
MDALRPGHAHRSSSDRLLNNYLDSQKSLTTSLLTLLSHSHSSTSSLLAYSTSSPGVIVPIRKAVRHAAFEGPLSPELMSHPENGHGHDEEETQGGWAAYVRSLDDFRKDLKQIHLLEEEMSRVKRDREILVTRLIKTTKSRPSRSDLSAIASSYSHAPPASSRSSILSMSSNGSTATKEGKRAGKLAEAQAELLGCEEHLRGLEVRIENERNKVMMRGLEERFRAMEVVGRMWVTQAKRGLGDLERLQDLPPDAFELDSNGSLAPSQSASQVAYEDSPRRGNNHPYKHFAPPGSITGSIAEEDENGSSGDEAPAGKLVMHENRPGSRAQLSAPKQSGLRNGSNVGRSTTPGVPSINERSRPLSATLGGSQRNAGGYGNGNDSDSDSPAYGAGGRRAASDVGAMGYRPPKGRQPLRRTFSDDQHSASGGRRRGGSDTSSIRQHTKKKGGFFASIGRFFKGNKRRDGSIRSGRDSPPYGSSSKGGWHTRTDSNIKRASTLGGRRRGGDDSSSDEEDRGGLVSVTNNRNNTWAIDNNKDSRGSIKRSSTMPIHSGLIPPKPTRSDLGMKRNSSQSTITASNNVNRARSPTPLGSAAKATAGVASGGISRSNTVKSSMSTGTAKTTGTVKSSGTATKKKTRPNGSISRASITSEQAAQGRSIMSLVDNSAPPVMPEVPKAPKSQVTPNMELPKAPGSSIVAASAQAQPVQKANVNREIPTLGRSISQSNSINKISKPEQTESVANRSTTPLPPSRTLSPPLKSALRPQSPVPTTASLPPPQSPKPMYSVSAPGPVQLTPEEEKPQPMAKVTAPVHTKRNSFQSMTSDNNSVYESAVEDGGHDDDSSEDEDMEGYKVVENDKVARAGDMATGRARDQDDNASAASDDTVGAAAKGNTNANRATAPPPMYLPTAPTSTGGSALGVNRRKSVRMAVPDSPSVEKTPPPEVKAPAPLTNAKDSQAYRGEPTQTDDSGPQVDRAPSPEPERMQEQWSTRIGRMREDTSDEEDVDPDYMKARKGLAKIDKKWEAMSKEERERNEAAMAASAKVKKRGSVKSKSSVKSRGSRV